MRKPSGPRKRSAAAPAKPASKRARPAPRAAQTGNGATAFYVYCLGASDECQAAARGNLPPAMEDGAGIEVLACGRLAAILSAVPLKEYGPEALQHRVGDASWMAVRAMRHENMVNHFAARGTVVPLRFGALYLDRSRIRRMLLKREPQLQKILRKLRSRDEWGLTVYQSASPPAEDRAASPALPTSGPGQAYLLRKKREANRGREMAARVQERVRAIEKQLAPLCADSTRLRVLKGDASEYGKVAARLAFLIPRTAFPRFRTAAEQLAHASAADGVRLELTGPWPPYNFVAE